MRNINRKDNPPQVSELQSSETFEFTNTALSLIYFSTYSAIVHLGGILQQYYIFLSLITLCCINTYTKEIHQTTNLLYEDASVTIESGENPEVVLVKYKIINSLAQETNIVEYTVIPKFHKTLAERTELHFKLYQNYPNPFNPQTTFSFCLPENSKVNLTVYDILGKEVTMLVNDNLTRGSYDVNFNAAELSSGIYFCRLSAGKYSETKKLQLIK